MAALAAVLVGIRLFGAETGAPCADSYSCRGFLFGGAECVDVESGAYCTLYCSSDATCPRGWHCLAANPTVLRVRTKFTDKVCIKQQ